MSFSIESNAKINLALYINHQRSDGYHDISTLMQEIDLSDEISISKNNHSKINIQSKGIPTPIDSTNLCYIAAKLFLNAFNIKSGIDITINKKIPIGAGLGGGSSNAISTIKALIKIFKVNMDYNDFFSMSSRIGADVPFFIRGGLQVGDGIGEKLTQIKGCMPGIYLLVVPNLYIDTSWAYSQFKNGLDSSESSINFASLLNKKTTSFNELKLIENDFESIVIPTYPEIGEIKEKLCAFGAQYASLSGSGSTVFGIFNDEASLEKAFSYFTPKYNTFISCPI